MLRGGKLAPATYFRERMMYIVIKDHDFEEYIGSFPSAKLQKCLKWVCPGGLMHFSLGRGDIKLTNHLALTIRYDGYSKTIRDRE